MNPTNEALDFVKNNYMRKFGSLDDFDLNYNLYLQLPAFDANGNFHEAYQNLSKYANRLPDEEEMFVVGDKSLKPEIHWIMRSFTQYYLTQAFHAMKVNMDDPNVRENALGKGTPGRIAKMWCGNDPEDITELGSGRWNKQPYISCFPNTDQNHSVVTKSVDIVSNCSHHFLPFTTLDVGKATISYIPKDHVLGISKLQRFVTWCSRRFWLQEDLTQYIGKTIQRIAETEDVMVIIENAVHGCEKYRGANSKDGSLTTSFKGGVFKDR